MGLWLRWISFGIPRTLLLLAVVYFCSLACFVYYSKVVVVRNLDRVVWKI